MNREIGPAVLCGPGPRRATDKGTSNRDRGGQRTARPTFGSGSRCMRKSERRLPMNRGKAGPPLLECAAEAASARRRPRPLLQFRVREISPGKSPGRFPGLPRIARNLLCRQSRGRCRMKMVFFSTDPSEIELLQIALVQAGIRCEIRHSPEAGPALPHPACAELWIQKDADLHRTLLLCVQLGIGFARRPPKAPGFAFAWEI